MTKNGHLDLPLSFFEIQKNVVWKKKLYILAINTYVDRSVFVAVSGRKVTFYLNCLIKIIYESDAVKNVKKI